MKRSKSSQMIQIKRNLQLNSIRQISGDKKSRHRQHKRIRIVAVASCKPVQINFLLPISLLVGAILSTPFIGSSNGQSQPQYSAHLADFSSQDVDRLNQMLSLTEQQQQELIISNELLLNGQQQQHSGQPGHYEFDVAPKMEPPSVRKPPYRQTSQTCSGSDLLGGFSLRDTLCGDLNQGRVPLNPLGQMVTDQAYPFEVIKNKTLQFLARALPILKLEYESIPKVARYLSANQLLNPTSFQSPLGLSHFHELNQHFNNQQASHQGLGQSASSMSPPPMMFKQQQQQHHHHHGSRKRRSVMSVGSITVAEMMPNATLVVSSAHSAGRIQSKRMAVDSVNAAGGAGGPLMVTKDGLRPLVAVNGGGGQLSVSRHASNSNPGQQRMQAASPKEQHPRRDSEDQLHRHLQQKDHGNITEPTASEQRDPSTAASVVSRTGGPPVVANNNHAANRQATRVDNLVSSGNKLATNNAAVSGQLGHANQVERPDEWSDRRRGDAATGAKPMVPSTGDQHKLKRHTDNNGHQLEARSAETGAAGQQVQPVSGAGANNNNNLPETQGQPNRQQAEQPRHQHNPKVGNLGSTKRRLNCAELGGGAITSTVCQTAAALIEGDKAPAWVQVAKQIGNLYASSQSTDQLGGAWPWLSLLGGGAASSSLPASSEQTNAKSSGGDKLSASPMGSLTSVWNLISPLANFLAGPSDHSSSRGSQAKQSSDATSTATSSSSNSQLASSNPLSAASLTKMALAGWATTAIAGLVEYLAPTVFSSASRSFARRKKPFDPSETFVDTPASLAALSDHAAKMKSLGPSSSAALNGNTNLQLVAQAKQPPTPCPSVEEYISPTFARNYQGAWKYVVQIPHEGYFTQTIQRSSCMRQKCEFTEGVCHEAPRWVSLLVAEIYYPNAIFSQQPAADQPTGSNVHQMATAHSMNHLQQVALGHNQKQQQQQHQHQAKQHLVQDPLQMTDSLNTFNLNNVALLNAANQLGLDPTNLAQMQQLADAHNYQLIQRNGLASSSPNNPLVLESRASHGHGAFDGQAGLQQQQPSSLHMSQYPGNAATYQPGGQTNNVKRQQQLSQAGLEQPPLDLGSSMSYNEYIRALAAETLRQNPHLTIDDLIKSLQLQTGARKKRDLAASQQHQTQVKYQSNYNPAVPRSSVLAQQQYQQQQQQQQQQPQQPLSSGQFETNGSINDLGGSFSVSPTQQQAFASARPHSDNQQAISAKHQQQPTATSPTAVDPIQANSIGTPASSSSQNESQMSSGGSTNGQPSASTPSASASQECDGHDKIGCYVVRVYYDWFLVNGSCKCWRTSSSSANMSGQQTQSGSSGNSFLRRIFTG